MELPKVNEKQGLGSDLTPIPVAVEIFEFTETIDLPRSRAYKGFALPDFEESSHLHFFLPFHLVRMRARAAALSLMSVR